MNRRSLASLCSLAFLIAAQGGGGTADFLVVEKVEDLLIHNKYQQEASVQERQVFAPFVPMRILNTDETLADGFTHCTRVEVAEQIYYLLKDKDGNLSRGKSGFERIYSGATIIADTVLVLTDRALRFSPVNSSAQQLVRGERLRRVFQHQNRVYCQLLGSPEAFGWVEFAIAKEGRGWEVLQHTLPSNAALPPMIVQKIHSRLEEANNVLANLFSFFNRQTQHQRVPPRWSLVTAGKSLWCTLEGTTVSDDYQQSTFYLVNSIENIVLGSGYAVTHSNGKIEVQPR